MEIEGTDQKAQVLTKSLTDVAETLRWLMVIAEEFRAEDTVESQQQKQAVLNSKLNTLIEQLSQVYNNRKLVDFEIPLEILDFVDKGNNPDRFTREALENAIQRSEHTRGKTKAFRDFKSVLETEIKNQLPDLFDNPNP